MTPTRPVWLSFDCLVSKPWLAMRVVRANRPNKTQLEDGGTRPRRTQAFQTISTSRHICVCVCVCVSSSSSCVHRVWRGSAEPFWFPKIGPLSIALSSSAIDFNRILPTFSGFSSLLSKFSGKRPRFVTRFYQFLNLTTCCRVLGSPAHVSMDFTESKRIYAVPNAFTECEGGEALDLPIY